MIDLFPDIGIAVVLVAIALVVILIARMGILPKKSLPYVAAALAGVTGIAVFQRIKAKGLAKELEARRRALQDLEGRLAQTRARFEASDQTQAAVRAELQRQEEAVQKAILVARANTDAQRQEIDNLSGEEVFRRFDEVFGGPRPPGGGM